VYRNHARHKHTQLNTSHKPDDLAFGFIHVLFAVFSQSESVCLRVSCVYDARFLSVTASLAVGSSALVPTCMQILVSETTRYVSRGTLLYRSVNRSAGADTNQIPDKSAGLLLRLYASATVAGRRL